MRYYAILLICTVILSCNKKSDNSFPPSFLFKISGLKDTTITYKSSASFTVNITSQSNVNGTVSLSAPNLPKHIKAQFSPVSATTPFQSVVTFSSTDSSQTGYLTDTWGNFQVSIFGQNYYVKDSATSKLTITQPADVIYYFLGTWQMSHQCQADSIYNYGVRFELDSTTNNGLIIHGFSYTSSVLKAVIDPVKKTITIPSQVYGGYTYEGSGPFKIGTTLKSSMDFSYSIISTSTSYFCDGTLTK